MGKPQPTPKAEAGFASYRVTSEGRAAAGPGHTPLRTRHLVDLLDLINMSTTGVSEPQLRQFMPPASLGESIHTLLQMGLIECK